MTALDNTEAALRSAVDQGDTVALLALVDFLREQGRDHDAHMVRVRVAYEQATGQWDGCYWEELHFAAVASAKDYYDDSRRRAIHVDADGLVGDEEPEDVAQAACWDDWDDLDDEERRPWLTAAEHAIIFAAGVAAEAARAEELAARALAHAEAGDWDWALDSADAACWRERQYGDSPTWSPFRARIREALAEADREASE